MRLNRELLQNISQKFMEMGNLAVAALTFGAVFTEKSVKWWIFLSGIGLWCIFYLLGIIIGKGDES